MTFGILAWALIIQPPRISLGMTGSTKQGMGNYALQNGFMVLKSGFWEIFRQKKRGGEIYMIKQSLPRLTSFLRKAATTGTLDSRQGTTARRSLMLIQQTSILKKTWAGISS